MDNSPPESELNPSVPMAGGGLPVLKYWAKKTLSPQGIQLWKTLNHKSACLACAWGTGGQKGGFVNEQGETLQRCMKSVEAITSDLMPGIKSDFFANYTLEQLQQLTSQECDRLGRLSYPVIRRAGSDHYERLSWEEVYAIATESFQRSPERVASYSSGRSSNEAAFLLQLLMRTLGSNNLADCSDLCHAASSMGLKQVFGANTSMVSLESLEHSDCVVLIGSNAPANTPRLMNELLKLRQRGGKIIIINPQIEVGLVKFSSPAFPIRSLLRGGSDVSTLYLQPIPGSDVAVFVGLQKALLEQNLVHHDYLAAYTDHATAVLDYAKNTPWSEIMATCGLYQEELEATATLLGNCERVVFAWAMGVTQQVHGVDNVLSIANTALMTGNAGKLGAGTMPIRGHSNVQGFGSMGVTIHLREEIATALEHLLGRPLQLKGNYNTRGLMTAADAGKVDTLFCLGGNLYAANPDLKQAQRALGQIETIFYVATKPNLGHFHGLAKENTLILPVFTRFENPHRTTTESGNNFVRLNDPGKSHLQRSDCAVISEVELLTEIAHRIHGDRPVDWRRLQDTVYVRQLIAQTIPGYQAIADIDQTKTEFIIEGRIFTEPHFPTANGKAQMAVTPLPQLKPPTVADFNLEPELGGIGLILGTGRSYGQHNTVVYQASDKYRGMPHRHCLLMNALDAAKAGFQAHQRVTVKGDAGELTDIEIIFGAIREGVGFMFYPEANVLFTAQIDPRSGTPAFKRVPVWVLGRSPEGKKGK